MSHVVGKNKHSNSGLALKGQYSSIVYANEVV